MSDLQINSTFSEKLRRIRFRRTREKTRFRDELRIIPKWLIVMVIVLFLIAQVAFFIANFYAHALSTPQGELWPLPNYPALSALSVAGIVTAAGILLAALFLAFGYVNRDAKRRGMNSALWTILVVVLSPGWLALGFFIYFLMREPLPYNCPQCGATVAARFNFCPSCKCNLQPTCPQCKREVGEIDKFCPYCACELTPGAVAGGSAVNDAPIVRSSV
ncbi:MAG TPA: zinc ribbon domain-containing protein [Candidatus Acidoferrum sp.]|jgi:ABC-type Fe3+ transport system permease subunit|nr:zinc ribbon domain-containing protein [Candidatus Acidoferrum sp.]